MSFVSTVNKILTCLQLLIDEKETAWWLSISLQELDIWCAKQLSLLFIKTKPGWLQVALNHISY